MKFASLATMTLGTLTLSLALALPMTAAARTARSSTTTSAATSTTTNTPAIDLPASPASNLSASAGRRTSLNWDAFIDVEGRIWNKEATALLPDHGATLNDAALYLSKDFSRATAVVDLPFFSNYSGSNNFQFSGQKAQAYVQTSFGQQFGVRLGQYDSFFGIEANDSIARFFANNGLMKSLGVIPYTHTGVQGVMNADRFTIRGQIANPNSAGSIPPSTFPELGGQVRFDSGAAFGAFGFQYGRVRTDAPEKDKVLVEFMGGAAVEKITFGAQVDIKKSPLTPGADKTGLGIGVLGTYQHDADLGFGGRFDYLKDMGIVTSVPAGNGAGAANATAENALLLSFGPSYKLEQDLTVRGDFTLGSLKPQGGTDETVFGIGLSLVARL